MPLDLDRLTQALGDCPVGHTVDYHQTLTSTMTRARQLAAAGARSGTVVVAEEQSAGRGRQQRRWEAPAKSALLSSFLLKSPLPIALAQLPMLAGLAVVDALVAFEPRLAGQVGLKWPNDILLGTTPPTAKKVAGILIETTASSPADLVAIVGIGINVNQIAADLPPGQPGAPLPTSLRLHLHSAINKALDRTTLLIALCQSLGRLLEDPPAADVLWQRWRNALWTLNQPVSLREQTSPVSPIFTGLAVDVTPTGDLVVVDAQGERRTFAAGDVSLRAA